MTPLLYVKIKPEMEYREHNGSSEGQHLVFMWVIMESYQYPGESLVQMFHMDANPK